MSFEDFQIKPLLITELYKNVLVDLNPINNKTEEKIRYLGQNEKNVLIVVNEPQAVYINEEDLQLLTGILNACKLTLADTAIINIHNKNIFIAEIDHQLQAAIILLFGTTPADIELPLNFPPFQLQQYNSKQILSAPSLKELAVDVASKKLLWASLQKIFSK